MNFTLGVFAGSGIENERASEGAEVVRVHAHNTIQTPFGPPAGDVTEYNWKGVRVLRMNRHGPGHGVAPHNLPWQANCWALIRLGANAVVGVSAVGSLRPNIRPGQLVIPHQLVTFVQGRPTSFFLEEDKVVTHINGADPFDLGLCQLLAESARSAKVSYHSGTNYICIQGPEFSTRLASKFYRDALGCDTIGMTNHPEWALFREGQCPYAALQIVTDWDSCVPEGEKSQEVSHAMVVQQMQAYGQRAWQVIDYLVGHPHLFELGDCSSRKALEGAVATPEEFWSDSGHQKMRFLKWINARR